LEKDLQTYQKMAREIFDSLVKAVGIHVMLLVIEKAFWKTKHMYEEASLISFSEDGINLDRLEELEQEKAALVAHDFVMAIIDNSWSFNRQKDGRTVSRAATKSGRSINLERIATGIKALDDILQGGFPAGAAVLVVGCPGTGKTILAHQTMFYNAAPDSKVIYLTTLAEPQVKVMKFQQEFTYFDFSKVQNSVIYHDLGSVLRKNGPGKAISVVDELLKKHQPRLLIIDTIKTIADMIPSLTEFREFILDFSLRTATWGCTTILLGEYSEGDIEIRPESAIADGIIYLYGLEEKKKQKRFLRVLKMRGTNYAGGENFFNITENGIEVFQRLNPVVANQQYSQFGERIATGIADLDNMTNGGLPRASTTLVSGATGTGKSILALHFACAGVQAGEKAVYVTFEVNPRQIISQAPGFGMDIQRYVDSGQLYLVHVSPIELDIDEHVYRIQKTVQDTGAQRLVIDSISSFELGISDKIKYTDHIWSLTDYFKSLGVTVLLTHEMTNSWGELSQITKHGVSYVADNLIMLSYQEQGSELKSFLRVIKMRAGNHSKTQREICIDSNGLTLAKADK